MIFHQRLREHAKLKYCLQPGQSTFKVALPSWTVSFLAYLIPPTANFPVSEPVTFQSPSLPNKMLVKTACCSHGSKQMKWIRDTFCLTHKVLSFLIKLIVNTEKATESDSFEQRGFSRSIPLWLMLAPEQVSIELQQRSASLNIFIMVAISDGNFFFHNFNISSTHIHALLSMCSWVIMAAKRETQPVK